MGEPAATKKPTWGDDLRRYKAKKTAAAWDVSAEAKSMRHVTRYEKSREERRFDPILQHYREPTSESAARKMEATQVLTSLNKARDKQLRYTQTYDIITHVPNTKEPAAKPRPEPRADSRTNYNIITNMGLHEHHYLPPGKRPPKPPTPPKKETLASATTKREFDILSNKYHQNHEEKDAVDQEMRRQAAATRFWETRSFDPVRCRYYDDEKEGDHWNHVEEEKKTWGQKQFAKLPPSMKVAEGVAYNLLTMEERNKDAMDARAKIVAKASKQRIRDKVEARLKASGEEVEMKKEQRMLGRVSHQRHVEATRNGFNLVNGLPFDGLNATKTFASQTHVPRGVWAKAEVEREVLGATRRAARPSSEGGHAAAAGGAPSARPMSSPSKGGGARSRSGSVRSGGFGQAAALPSSGASVAAPPTESGAAPARATPASRREAPASNRSGSVRTGGFR